MPGYPGLPTTYFTASPTASPFGSQQGGNTHHPLPTFGPSPDDIDRVDAKSRRFNRTVWGYVKADDRNGQLMNYAEMLDIVERGSRQDTTGDQRRNAIMRSSKMRLRDNGRMLHGLKHIWLSEDGRPVNPRHMDAFMDFFAAEMGWTGMHGDTFEKIPSIAWALDWHWPDFLSWLAPKIEAHCKDLAQCCESIRVNGIVKDYIRKWRRHELQQRLAARSRRPWSAQVPGNDHTQRKSYQNMVTNADDLTADSDASTTNTLVSETVVGSDDEAAQDQSANTETIPAEWDDSMFDQYVDHYEPPSTH
ncbi:hypothetical protein GGR53DRAFT_462873 [Hypoxylon sp. FL1150]|nr:hypothetical protein GGR53DRAFT_462873 [Hypoxylon sp. FL1150]